MCGRTQVWSWSARDFCFPDRWPVLWLSRSWKHAPPAAPPPVPLESDKSRNCRPEDAERESRGRGLAVLPALPFPCFLPGAVGKEGPFLLPHPLGALHSLSTPSPHLFPPNWSRGPASGAKSAAWSGLLRKGFQRLPFDKSQSLQETEHGVQLLGAGTVNPSPSRRKITSHSGSCL